MILIIIRMVLVVAVGVLFGLMVISINIVLPRFAACDDKFVAM